MRPTTRRCRFVFSLTILMAAMPLLAQERCLLSDTMNQCFDRYRTSPEAYVVEERQALQDQPTGVDTGGANLTTGTKDFSPLMLSPHCSDKVQATVPVPWSSTTTSTSLISSASPTAPRMRSSRRS